MHPKDEDDTNYFSYVDSNVNKLSMVELDVINFISDKKFELAKFKKDSSIWIQLKRNKKQREYYFLYR